jgi:hypothetical protein
LEDLAKVTASLITSGEIFGMKENSLKLTSPFVLDIDSFLRNSDMKSRHLMPVTNTPTKQNI